MGLGYNAINNFDSFFIKQTTQRPIIGFKSNDDIDAHSYDGVFNTDIIVTPGSFIQAQRATDSKAGNVAYNPNVFVCKEAEATKVSGVLLYTGLEVHGIGDKSGAIKQGQFFKWACIGSGSEVYLMVHTTNATGITANSVFPLALTLDVTNGGVKVASGSDVVIGHAISNVIANCQYLKNDSGVLQWDTCLGIKVRL